MGEQPTQDPVTTALDVLVVVPPVPCALLVVAAPPVPASELVLAGAAAPPHPNAPTHRSTIAGIVEVMRRIANILSGGRPGVGIAPAAGWERVAAQLQ
jgi:hypothetical protein